MRGGKRENSGRKKATDRKKQIGCYFLESEIEKLGKENCRLIAEKAVHEAFLSSI